eukprot:jgi/Psemu1/312710/fgenesh1_kg.1005_\
MQKSSENNGGVQPPPAVEIEMEQLSFRDVREDISSDVEDNSIDGSNIETRMFLLDMIAEGEDTYFPLYTEANHDPSLRPECVSRDGVDGPSSLNEKQSSNCSNSMANSDSKPNSDSESNDSAKDVKFRAYQAENWTEKFESLLEFREKHGHCLVPNCHPQNPALAQWIKRQRYQYKLKLEGKRSTITEERVQALEKAGFIWDSHKAVWSERLEELKAFKRKFNHCNVPSRYKPNHQLAIWVKRQRRQWKNKIDQLPNCMTDERQQVLEAIGFVWDMKKEKKQKGNKGKEEVGK